MSSSSFDLPSGPLPVFRFISGPPLVDPWTSGRLPVALLCHSGPSLISAPPQTVAHPSELCPVPVIRINFRFRSSAGLAIFILAHPLLTSEDRVAASRRSLCSSFSADYHYPWPRRYVNESVSLSQPPKSAGKPSPLGLLDDISGCSGCSFPYLIATAAGMANLFHWRIVHEHSDFSRSLAGSSDNRWQQNGIQVSIRCASDAALDGVQLPDTWVSESYQRTIKDSPNFRKRQVLFFNLTSTQSVFSLSVVLTGSTSSPLFIMLFNFNLAIIAVLAGAGLVASASNDDHRLRRLGRVVAVRQSSCQSDADCDGSSVCCSGLAFGPGEGAGIGSCVDLSACSGVLLALALRSSSRFAATSLNFVPLVTALRNKFCEYRIVEA
ncbi:hypothetical protein B0H10DRAFT_1972479 [Mycena sp. CBHHK59/15]|nr:hypothetical protein B0H10DRAFT_1972479 [Mycena sp. CBHHK59/15]